MRFYGECPGASMHMKDDPELIALLEPIIRDTPIEIAIETGTYLGTGSTRFIADAFCRVREPTLFYTIEANYENAMQARRNLTKYEFVLPVWGNSVYPTEAEVWIRTDDALAHPEQHPDIWIDHMSDAVTHYTAEARGSDPDIDRSRWAGDRLLEKFLKSHRDSTPLVILDSAGGIGWLEFNVLIENMRDKPYYLLLDDVGHVKHFRSMAHMQAHPETFTILGSRDKWALARANG